MNQTNSNLVYTILQAYVLDDFDFPSNAEISKYIEIFLFYAACISLKREINDTDLSLVDLIEKTSTSSFDKSIISTILDAYNSTSYGFSKVILELEEKYSIATTEVCKKISNKCVANSHYTHKTTAAQIFEKYVKVSNVPIKVQCEYMYFIYKNFYPLHKGYLIDIVLISIFGETPIFTEVIPKNIT